PVWEREVSLCLKKLRLEDIQQEALAGQASYADGATGSVDPTGGAEAQTFLSLVLNEETEEEAVDYVIGKAAEIVVAHFESELPRDEGELRGLFANYQVSRGRARRFVRGLRE